LKKNSLNLYSRTGREFIPFEKRNYYINEYKNNIIENILEERAKSPIPLLLDSSLITATQYDYKLIDCGDYIQIYKFHIKKKTKNKKDKKLIDYDYLFKKNNLKRSSDLKVIEYKNIMRSKFQLQRIVKTNEKVFKTFITLTFSDNVKDIETANKKFAIWRTKINSIFKGFQYVCVPEFQKRGAVHYHLMTNIEINKIYYYTRRLKSLKTELIISQENNNSKYNKCYDVKYWPYGFTSVYPLDNINVVGYITKYMTKDIDNRLWGKNKYLCSNNLKRPKEILIDSDIIKENSKLFLIQNIYDLKYQNNYFDIYNNEIQFMEYKL